jgi:catechol 2,3-dioxygenase-like lactoylglutathione lyase family enzyme
MSERGFKVQGLGEIAIRCVDFDAMLAFYRDVIGLEVMSLNAELGVAFFRISNGVAGHTNVLALFRDGAGTRDAVADSDKPPLAGARSSLHHIALSLPFDELKAAMHWYEGKGLPFEVETFQWAGWRGVFTQDPDGNTVELVAFSANLKADQSIGRSVEVI